jgi:hypothetical protein
MYNSTSNKGKNNLKKEVNAAFNIDACLEAIDKPRTHYHEHNLPQQTLTIIQIIWELNRMYDLYTD